LEKCDKPYGTLTVAEAQDAVISRLLQYGLPSPTGVIRMMVQQSNCFVLVERGRAMNNIMQERQLAESGELRAGSNMGKGQMVTADYVPTPDAVFSSKDSGGGGAAPGGFGVFGSVASVVAGGLKMYSQPSKTSKVVASLAKGEEVIFTGEEKNGFMSVQGNGGEGWVEKILVRK